jgi:hypothetical protein
MGISTVDNSINVITDNLILYLDAANGKSYENGSYVWNDLTKNQYNGYLVNDPTFDSSNLGNLEFDGSTSYITIPKFRRINNSFTISMWVYPTSLFGIRPLFVNWWQTGREILLRFNSNTLQFYTFAGFGQIGGTTQTYNDINKWANIVATYDGSVMRTYVNGIQSVTTYSQTGALGISPEPYLIARYSSPIEYRYEGRVSQTLLYTSALSAVQIIQNYNTLKSRFGL